MACGKNYFMSSQGQNSSWQKLIYTGGKANQSRRNRKLGSLWRFYTLSSYLKRMRWQDRTHAAVVSHVTSLLLSEGWRANTHCSAHSRKKWGRHNADSFWWEYLWNCCINLARDRVGWLPVIQQLHPPILFWSNQYVYITHNIGVCHGTN